MVAPGSRWSVPGAPRCRSASSRRNGGRWWCSSRAFAHRSRCLCFWFCLPASVCACQPRCQPRQTYPVGPRGREGRGRTDAAAVRTQLDEVAQKLMAPGFPPRPRRGPEPPPGCRGHRLAMLDDRRPSHLRRAARPGLAAARGHQSVSRLSRSQSPSEARRGTPTGSPSETSHGRDARAARAAPPRPSRRPDAGRRGPAAEAAPVDKSRWGRR